jgi:hypothetical protein
VGNISPPPEVVEEWTTRIAAARRCRDAKQQEAKQADATFRESIRGGFRAGLSATPIAEAAELSTFRCYQINNGRRT